MIARQSLEIHVINFSFFFNKIFMNLLRFLLLESHAIHLRGFHMIVYDFVVQDY